MTNDSHDGEQPSLEEAFAERDAQIRELQLAVIELANAAEAGSPSPAPAAAEGEAAAFHERIARLENKLAEQDHMIRHTLTMLIEWIEADDAQRSAA